MQSANATTGNQHSVWVRFEWNLRAALPDVVPPALYRFRSARVHELEQVRDVVLNAYGSDPIWAPLITDIERRMTERIATTFGQPSTDYVVAEREEQIVAVSGVALSHWTQQNLLTGLCVLPSHQRRGVGKHLLFLSLRRLQEMGLERATVYTERGSVADLALYPRFNSVREEGVVYPALSSPSKPGADSGTPSGLIKHNVYFEGQVQSLGFNRTEGYTTLGVIIPGTYRFSAEMEEHVTLIKGRLMVRIGESWREVVAGEAYCVPRGTRFDVQTEEHVAYICDYK